MRSFGQIEKELKFIAIPEKFYPYIHNDNISCFRDACNTFLEEKEKNKLFVPFA